MRDLKMLIPMWLFVCLLSQLHGSVNSSNIQENTLKIDGVKDASAGIASSVNIIFEDR